MFKSIFNKKTKNDVSTNSNLGLEKDFPILMDSIASSYSFLNSLCSTLEGITYERIGTTESNGYANQIDKYVFLIHSEKLCSLFVYAYHTESLPLIPLPFKRLNPNIDNSIFDIKKTPKKENKIDNRLARFNILITFILQKNSIVKDEDVVWNQEKQNTLTELLNELGYEENLESLILHEWSLYTNNANTKKNDFIKNFISEFHHSKLSKYTPVFIQERNQKIEKAYNSIIETINRIQAWLDNEPLRIRIESTLLTDNFSNIKQCTTPFCIIHLACDEIGRYSIAYGIETRILEMLSNNMASTLIRRIYQFTPGELESFVGIIALNTNCIKLFEELLDRSKQEKKYKVIKVQRNEEESISAMLSKLKLKDDIDDETKKWLNK